MFAGGFAGGFARRFAGAVFALGALAAAGALGTLGAAPLGAQMTVGIRGGVGAATLSKPSAGPRAGQAFDGPRYSLLAGVDGEMPLIGGLGVRLGMALAGKGGATEIPPSITGGRAFVESVAEFDYVQFSALLRASAAAEEGNLRFGLLAGPYVALNTACNVAVKSVEPPPIAPPAPPGDPNRVPSGLAASVTSSTSTVDTKVACGEGGVDEITSSEYGLAFGAGFEIRLSASLRVAFDLIYARSFTEIDDAGTKPNHIAIQTGVVFPIG